MREGRPEAATLPDLAHDDVLEPHLPFPAGMELERDQPVRVLRAGIGVVHGGHAVDPRLDVGAAHHGADLVPAVDHERLLRRLARLDEPAAPRALVEAARVHAGMRIDLHLDALDVDPVERRVIEDAAVPRALRLEPGLHLEVAIRLLRREVAVLLRDRHAVDLAVVHRPALLAVWLPARQVLAVEQRDPSAVAALGRGARGGGRRGRRRGGGAQAAHAHVAEPDVPALVMLKRDVPLRLAREPSHVLELARGHEGLEGVAAKVVLDGLLPVEPVLHVVVLHEQAHLVPLAHRTHRLVAGGGDQVVEGPRPVLGGILLVLLVVEDLQLGAGVPGGLAGQLGHAVQDPAIAARGELVLELELEVAVRLPGDEVARTLAAGDRLQRVSLDDPAPGRERVAAVAAPGVRGLAVEEDFPVVGGSGGRDQDERGQRGAGQGERHERGHGFSSGG